MSILFKHKVNWTYALGEIFLIFIGITLAIAFNNWNESNRERKLGLKYLANLKTDLQQDLALLDTMSAFREEKYHSANALLNEYSSFESFDPELFFSRMTSVMIWQEFSPHNNTIQEMVSSGNLSMIRNDTIKELVLNLHQQIVEITVLREHSRREFEHYLYDRLPGYINLNTYMELDDFRNSLTWQANKEMLVENADQNREDAIQFLSDKIVRHGFYLAAVNNIYAVNQYKSTKEQIQKLTRAIDREIN